MSLYFLGPRSANPGQEDRYTTFDAEAEFGPTAQETATVLNAVFGCFLAVERAMACEFDEETEDGSIASYSGNSDAEDLFRHLAQSINSDAEKSSTAQVPHGQMIAMHVTHEFF